MLADRIVATYRIESPRRLEEAAEALAGEQSTGTFIPVPGETPALRRRFRARVERVEALGTVPAPSLPGARGARTASAFHQGDIVLSFPFENVGANLPTLLSTVAGNLFELNDLSGVRLLDLHLPQAFAQAYPGPRFGVEGTRRLAGVTDRPIIGTIIKPSVGLTPDETAHLVSRLADAGIDFIKDDELMANPPHSPFAERVTAVMRAIDASAERTGKKAMYAFNITDDLDAMLRHHEVVRRAGGSCVMVSLHSVGLAALGHLRQRIDLPLHGHRNGWGLFARAPLLGIEFTAYQKLWRLTGVDHLHVNGLCNKFWEPDDSVVASITACLTPLFGGYQAMPVISSGQWGGQAPDTYRRTKTIDVIYLAGGGIMAHPAGPGAGVRAIRQAWEAAMAGVDLEAYATDRPELRAALAAFGARPSNDN